MVTGFHLTRSTVTINAPGVGFHFYLGINGECCPASNTPHEPPYRSLAEKARRATANKDTREQSVFMFNLGLKIAQQSIHIAILRTVCRFMRVEVTVRTLFLAPGYVHVKAEGRAGIWFRRGSDTLQFTLRGSWGGCHTVL